MAERVRVILYAVAPDDDPEGVRRAYDTISTRLRGTPGLLGNELLRDAHAPGRFAVLSEWESLTAFRAWEDGSEHREATAPLRPHQDPALRPRVFEVVAAY